MRKAGTKKLWMVSSEVITSFTARPRGTCSSLISRCPVGCCSFHIQRLPTTLTVIASSGGRFMWKKTLAPHTNMTAMRTSGTMVQVSSRASEPWISAGRSSSERRR